MNKGAEYALFIFYKQELFRILRRPYSEHSLKITFFTFSGRESGKLGRHLIVFGNPVALAQVGNKALTAQGLARDAHVAAVQNKPMVRVL